MWRGLRVCGGRFLASQQAIGRSIRGLTRPEIRPYVVGEEDEHLVRHFPLGFREPLLDETVDGDGEEPDARLEREMQLIEDSLALPQERGYLGYEVIDHALHPPGVCERVVSNLCVLQFHQLLDVRHAERGDFLPQGADVVQAIDTDGVTPAAARLGVA